MLGFDEHGNRNKLRGGRGERGYRNRLCHACHDQLRELLADRSDGNRILHLRWYTHARALRLRCAVNVERGALHGRRLVLPAVEAAGRNHSFRSFLQLVLCLHNERSTSSVGKPGDTQHVDGRSTELCGGSLACGPNRHGPDFNNCREHCVRRRELSICAFPGRPKRDSGGGSDQ